MQHDANAPDIISSPNGTSAVDDATSEESKGADSPTETAATTGVTSDAPAPGLPKPIQAKPNRVRENRIANMMSKAELARRANLSVLTIDRIEKGYGCRIHTKRKILEALGLTPADRVRVFGEEE